jgi:hypothetical protein
MRLLPVSLAAAATVLALVWVASRPPVGSEPAATGAKAPAAALRKPAAATSSPAPAPVAGANPLAAVKAMPVKATLFNEFLAARDYRAIYDRLDGSPEGATAEGRLVLYEILRQCATITEGRRYTWKPPTPKPEEFLASIAPTDPNRDKRIAAYEQFTANRCAGFEGVSLTQAELDRLLAESAAAGDPRAKAMSIEQQLWQARRSQGRNGATITDDQVAALQQIAGTRDPEAIRVAGRVLSNSWADYSLRIGPGQQPIEPRAFMNAWLVLACEFGQPCGADTTRMQQACAMQGHCDAQSFPDYLWYYSSSPHDSQLLVQYRAYLRQAIETGDWSQLSVARGVPQLPNRVTFVPGPR